MKKICFNDKYRLTQAVLDGLKTMTRRGVKLPRTFRGIEVAGFRKCTNSLGEWYTELYDEDERTIEGSYLKHHYEIGEVVAIAQSYEDCGYGGESLELMSSAGWNNKKFVSPALMPHRIRITNVKIERLQGISEVDCLREGIEEHLKGVQYGFPSNIGYCGQYPFSTPREAYSVLIDKVSGRGTWLKNPWVFAYEFELID